MLARITPGISANSVVIPPSKSMAHRAIIAASLSNGTSIITNVHYSDDILTTIDGMKSLGATIIKENDTLTITGIRDFNNLLTNEIQCNESGSTLRFFIPIFSLTNKEVKFLGKNRLLKRPQEIYKDIFNNQNLYYSQNDEYICIKNSIKPGKFVIPGNVSSQFITGLLYTLPLLKEDSEIEIIAPFESQSYIDLTLSILNLYGIKIEQSDNLHFKIKGNQSYKAIDYRVEGDFSQMAFFGVLAAINNDLDIKGLDPKSLQGDKEIINILSSFNVNMTTNEDGYSIKKSTLKAADIDLNNCPDLGPILCVLASLADGNTRIYNASRLKIKESDRMQAMVDELSKVGIQISCNDSEIFIKGNPNLVGLCNNFSGHKDHRIVMALSILSTILTNTSTIYDAEFISKSYPNFFEDLQLVGIEVETC